jgi:hypothetical protein
LQNIWRKTLYASWRILEFCSVCLVIRPELRI